MRSATAFALLGLALLLCLGRPALAANGIFYIAAEEMVWDYLPGGVNKCYRWGLPGSDRLWRGMRRRPSDGCP